MERIYENIILTHINNYDQMVFLTGGRQVGKTTLSQIVDKTKKTLYLNWEFLQDRRNILEDPTFIAQALDSVVTRYSPTMQYI